MKRSCSSTVRSDSVGVLKELGSLSAQAQSNQQAIISALQKLSDKQAARHYNSSSHIGLLTQHVSSLISSKPSHPLSQQLMSPGRGSFTMLRIKLT